MDEPRPTPNPTAGAGARPAPAALASSPREAPVAAPSRVVIEDVQPAIDGGRFPVKRTVGETVDVTADVFADGHDKLTAVLRYRLVPASAGQAPAGGHAGWREVEMEALGNDRWQARFSVEALGEYEFAVEAWIDRFGSWRQDLAKKAAAGETVPSELLEGAALIEQTAGLIAQGLRASEAGEPSDRQADARKDVGLSFETAGWLLEQADLVARGPNERARVAAALAPELASAMRRHADRSRAVRSATLRVIVEQERARFGAWYEMFPRSAGPDPTRSATLDEAGRRLNDIAAMGFDVVYLPPIHPIGVSFRKGLNNTLAAGPGDPGSPWAIGSAAGGHKSVEPGLGTVDDFDRFVALARRLGLEIALDIAFQTSPDHPYAREHPEWFRRRPDGSIKYAENPPKKYQDIYPFDFESDAWCSLWEELKSVVLFWIEHGVRVFRVDNPHTKAFPFWEWLIAQVRRDHPDVVFLAEAFTRPKVMRHLAKAGFSQSYSYFTWRNTKAELVDYFTELTATSVREYMRPNLFANTPDILHDYLQRGGRPAFRVRLVLAGTLGASYGIYSGFELCENRAVPGTEEYLDSEKFQIRRRDWDRPGNIKELVALVNQIRRRNPALQWDWSLRFHQTDNEQLIFYSKQSPDGANVVLVVVNLDPFNMQHGWIRVPVADWGLPSDRIYEVHDLLSDERYRWRGEWNYVRLDPGVRPAHILRLR